MTTWDHPALIVVGLVGALAISLVLLRLAQRPRLPDFVCGACGRRQRGLTVRDWRYCPYCGVPKGGSLRDLPKKRSILDVDAAGR